MIAEDNSDEPEVHFVKFETITDRWDLGYKMIFQAFRKYFSKPELKFERWYVTDFDNCLKGNPHIKEPVDKKE